MNSEQLIPDPRLHELMERFVAVGNPQSKFSASEFHEVYDGVYDRLEKLSAVVSAAEALMEHTKTSGTWTDKSAPLERNILDALDALK